MSDHLVSLFLTFEEIDLVLSALKPPKESDFDLSKLISDNYPSNDCCSGHVEDFASNLRRAYERRQDRQQRGDDRTLIIGQLRQELELATMRARTHARLAATAERADGAAVSP